MGTTRSSLKYKKAQRNIDYAAAALSYAYKTLKSEQNNTLEKDLVPILQKIFLLSKSIQNQSKENKDIISNLLNISENLTLACQSEKSSHKEKTDIINELMISVSQLSKKLIKHTQTSSKK